MHNTLQIGTDPDSEDLIVALNKIHDWHYNESQFCPFSPWTDVLVVFRPRKSHPAWEDCIYADADFSRRIQEATLDTGEIERVTNALNQLLMAYVGATGLWIGGQYLRPLSPDEIQGADLRVYALLASSDFSFSTLELYNAHREAMEPILTHGVPGMLAGGLHDLSSAVVPRMEQYLRLQQQFLYYEVAFKARKELRDGNFDMALINAAVAFESAHNEYIRQWLMPRIQARGFDPKKANEIVENYLREQGIAATSSVTPFLLLPERLVPTIELYEGMRRGIALRNSIMHGKTKGGRHEDRRFNRRELESSTSALLEVYEIYASLLESTFAVTE
jgi:hypothetical protein